MANSLIHTVMSTAEVDAFRRREFKPNYHCHDFGDLGFAVEHNGEQLFRASRAGATTYDVRYCERSFPDV